MQHPLLDVLYKAENDQLVYTPNFFFQNNNSKSLFIEIADKLVKMPKHPQILHLESYSLKPIRFYYNFIDVDDFIDLNVAFQSHSLDIQRNLFNQCVELVHHLHKNNIVHGNITPYHFAYNIVSKKVYLLHTSISEIHKSCISLNGGIPVFQSLRWLEPDVSSLFKSPKLPFLSDIYSLGATLLHCISDTNPFESSSPQRIYALVQSCSKFSSPPLHPINSKIPFFVKYPSLFAILEMMMLKNPLLRPPSYILVKLVSSQYPNHSITPNSATLIQKTEYFNICTMFSQGKYIQCFAQISENFFSNPLLPLPLILISRGFFKIPQVLDNHTIILRFFSDIVSNLSCKIFRHLTTKSPLLDPGQKLSLAMQFLSSTEYTIHDGIFADNLFGITTYKSFVESSSEIQRNKYLSLPQDPFRYFLIALCLKNKWVPSSDHKKSLYWLQVSSLQNNPFAMVTLANILKSQKKFPNRVLDLYRSASKMYYSLGALQYGFSVLKNQLKTSNHNNYIVAYQNLHFAHCSNLETQVLQILKKFNFSSLDELKLYAKFPPKSNYSSSPFTSTSQAQNDIYQNSFDKNKFTPKNIVHRLPLSTPQSFKSYLLPFGSTEFTCGINWSINGISIHFWDPFSESIRQIFWTEFGDICFPDTIGAVGVHPAIPCYSPSCDSFSYPCSNLQNEECPIPFLSLLNSESPKALSSIMKIHFNYNFIIKKFNLLVLKLNNKEFSVDSLISGLFTHILSTFTEFLSQHVCSDISSSPSIACVLTVSPHFPVHSIKNLSQVFSNIPSIKYHYITHAMNAAAAISAISLSKVNYAKSNCSKCDGIGMLHNFCSACCGTASIQTSSSSIQGIFAQKMDRCNFCQNGIEIHLCEECLNIKPNSLDISNIISDGLSISTSRFTVKISGNRILLIPNKKFSYSMSVLNSILRHSPTISKGHNSSLCQNIYSLANTKGSINPNDIFYLSGCDVSKKFHSMSKYCLSDLPTKNYYSMFGPSWTFPTIKPQILAKSPIGTAHFSHLADLSRGALFLALGKQNIKNAPQVDFLDSFTGEILNENDVSIILPLSPIPFGAPITFTPSHKFSLAQKISSTNIIYAFNPTLSTTSFSYSLCFENNLCVKISRDGKPWSVCNFKSPLVCDFFNSPELINKSSKYEYQYSQSPNSENPPQCQTS